MTTETIFSVDIMKKKLDSENLGIILLNEFMEEFFQKEECSTPDMFTLVHYNGLPQSNINSQVTIRLDFTRKLFYVSAFDKRKKLTYLREQTSKNLVLIFI